MGRGNYSNDLARASLRYVYNEDTMNHDDPPFIDGELLARISKLVEANPAELEQVVENLLRQGLEHLEGSFEKPEIRKTLGNENNFMER